jgi:hypothetical protein
MAGITAHQGRYYRPHRPVLPGGRNFHPYKATCRFQHFGL